jgi:hypothetical protein
MLDLLRSLLAPRTAVALPDAVECAALSDLGDSTALFAAFAGGKRRVGDAALVLAADEVERLRAAGVDWQLAMRLDELWRIALLVAATRIAVGAATHDEIERFVADCYRGGDTDERRAVLRALPLLPVPERFAALAADACRTSVRPIFEAIACENPYPARHLEPLHFDQMILKALFLGVPLARVIGLERRRTAELTRMARDYAAERRAAGRPVSADLAALAEERA